MSGDDVELMVRHRTTEIEGVKIFYREGGSPSAPAVLLLHGFPSSSFQFRYLLPALADHYYVLAPDFPAFGFSECPVRSRYSYTFDHYADTIEAFTNKLGLAQYALYVHDYGAQVGFRLALRSPERVAALVIQNSEAYEEGRTGSWSAMKRWSLPDEDCHLYAEGLHRGHEIAELIGPEIIALGWQQISRPEVVEALLDLHLDYQNNVGLYPRFQSYFRHHNPPALIIWGREDQYCTPAAATAYKRDLPDAEIHIIDGGHWALESHRSRVIQLTREFLDRECCSRAANLRAA